MAHGIEQLSGEKRVIARHGRVAHDAQTGKAIDARTHVRQNSDARNG